ncbi:hypothetical protein PM082_006803 [Marasmius tenuissimus]|nr:hypothetical protein PM082_006803 [Marasmius tenuissimus]
MFAPENQTNSNVLNRPSTGKEPRNTPRRIEQREPRLDQSRSPAHRYRQPSLRNRLLRQSRTKIWKWTCQSRWSL